jgi:ribosome maturation factor RimP
MDAGLLNTIIERALLALGYELLGVEYKAQGQRTLLRIYIDSEQGIGLTDCEKASRQISAALDIEDPMPGQYTLEVSSPGLERPLFKIAHYIRFTGHKIRLTTKKPLNGRRNFSGILENVDGDGRVQLRIEDVLYEFGVGDIDKAHLCIE